VERNLKFCFRLNQENDPPWQMNTHPDVDVLSSRSSA
jgi:hypothetical protein